MSGDLASIKAAAILAAILTAAGLGWRLGEDYGWEAGVTAGLLILFVFWCGILFSAADVAQEVNDRQNP